MSIKPFYMAIHTSFGSFQCTIAFRTFAHDSSLILHALMDGHVNMCIQSSYGACHMQQDFFPLWYLPFFPSRVPKG
jgi:hypothetical protein